MGGLLSEFEWVEFATGGWVGGQTCTFDSLGNGNLFLWLK